MPHVLKFAVFTLINSGCALGAPAPKPRGTSGAADRPLEGLLKSREEHNPRHKGRSHKSMAPPKFAHLYSAFQASNARGDDNSLERERERERDDNSKMAGDAAVTIFKPDQEIEVNRNNQDGETMQEFPGAQATVINQSNFPKFAETGPEASTINSLTSRYDNTEVAQAEADGNAEVSKAKQYFVNKHASNDVEQRLPTASLIAAPTALPGRNSTAGSSTLEEDHVLKPGYLSDTTSAANGEHIHSEASHLPSLSSSPALDVVKDQVMQPKDMSLLQSQIKSTLHGVGYARLKEVFGKHFAEETPGDGEPYLKEDAFLEELLGSEPDHAKLQEALLANVLYEAYPFVNDETEPKAFESFMAALNMVKGNLKKADPSGILDWNNMDEPLEAQDPADNGITEELFKVMCNAEVNDNNWSGKRPVFNEKSIIAFFEMMKEVKSSFSPATTAQDLVNTDPQNNIFMTAKPGDDIYKKPFASGGITFEQFKWLSSKEVSDREPGSAANKKIFWVHGKIALEAAKLIVGPNWDSTKLALRACFCHLAADVLLCRWYVPPNKPPADAKQGIC